MQWIQSVEKVKRTDKATIGGKGYALSLLAKGGFLIPETIYITTQAYHDFIDLTGIRERIFLEVNRKPFKDMRWEEIWDCATRIRNLFLRKEMPNKIVAGLETVISRTFSNRAVAVRSSAPEEDTTASSFAGLHESYVNIRGTAAILDHVRRVWASLWSDAALLYRQEIGLDAQKSSMAVIVQAVVIGDRSGVVFSKSPNDASQAVVESVYGLNQGLVDGSVEPDRWIVGRRQKKILSHVAADRKHRVIATDAGIKRSPLPGEMTKNSPLSDQEVLQVFQLSMSAEAYFKGPQDVEWTYRNNNLYTLQSRPITTLSPQEGGDNRGWYLSLHRTFENLKQLREEIENGLIPEMIQTADQMSRTNLTDLSDDKLVREIRHRWDINQKWSTIYLEKFIPYAHGIRLFGQIYNDALKPGDPYEFVQLLVRTDLASIKRNQMLTELAKMVHKNKDLSNTMSTGEYSKLDPAFKHNLDAFIQKFGDLSCTNVGVATGEQSLETISNLLLEMAEHPKRLHRQKERPNQAELEESYLQCFDESKQRQAKEMLDLARSSYRLRDDDNIYLGRIEAQFQNSLNEAKRRTKKRKNQGTNGEISSELLQTLEQMDQGPPSIKQPQKRKEKAYSLKARQLTGQPAGPGLSKGIARIVKHASDLASFKQGNILVCDSVDPTMTFVVPLASGIVERRGGMLIHGAIIAREYGLPCVTGVPDATKLIHTGDEVTVDGYLGIVTIGSPNL